MMSVLLRTAGLLTAGIGASLLVGCYDSQPIAHGPGGSDGGATGGSSATGGRGGSAFLGDTGGAPAGSGGAVAPIGGTTGIAGANGTGGIAGMSGSIGGATGMLCSSADIVVAGDLLGPNDTMVQQPLSISVTVASITPGTGGTDGKRTSQTLSLTSATGETWTFHVGMVGLPADLLTVGETVTLDAVFSSGVPTITLSRSGRLVIFFYSYHAFMGPFPPTLSKFGVTVTDDGAVCTNQSPSCTTTTHRARVTAGAASQTVVPGESAMIGALTVVLDRFQHSDCFDPDQAMVMGGWQGQ